MEFRVIRTCGECNQQDYYPVTKIEAAFNLYSTRAVWESTCSKCGSTNCAATSHPKPELDKELLDLWGKNPGYRFDQQDEEIILAEIENLCLFLDAIDNLSYPREKLNVLVAALCIVYYDNVVQPEEYSDEENGKRQERANIVLPELLKRKQLIKELPDWQIGEYIKEIVYPVLGLKQLL